MNGYRFFAIWWMILIVVFMGEAFSQETYRANQKSYAKINSAWYLLDAMKQPAFAVDSRIITVKFKSGVSQKDITALNSLNEARVLRTNRLGYSDIRLPASVDVTRALDKYLKSDLVQSAELNTIGKYIATPNDPDFGSQWHLSASGNIDINAPEAWGIESGDPSVIIAILDSGSDWEHQDLGLGNDSYQNIWLNPGEDAWSDPNDPAMGNGIDDDGNSFIDDWKGWDFHNGNNDSRGSNKHGTHVAGVVGAKTGNGIGIGGVAGGFGDAGCRMMIVGVGDLGPNSAILDDAILYAAENGARVIQMSLTLGSSMAIDDALAEAYQTHGCYITGASGNANGAVGYPASNGFVVAVGATDRFDQRAGFSNFGDALEVSAPGVDIYSTIIGDLYSFNDGTSFAAPQVAGLAGLLFSLNSALTNDQVRDLINQSALKVGGYDYGWNPGNPGHSRELGYGRINAVGALLDALQFDESVLNVFNSGRQHSSDLSMSRNGEWLAVWQSAGQDGDGNGIFGRLMRRDNPSSLVGEFQVNANSIGEQTLPKVASDNGFNYAIVRHSTHAGASIQGRFFTSDDEGSGAGVAFGDEMQVNQHPAVVPIEPDVAMNVLGRAQVVWSGFDPLSGKPGIYGRRATPSAIFDEVQINNIPIDFLQGSGPAVALAPSGIALVVWEANDDPSGSLPESIFGRFLDADGNPAGGQFRISSSTADFKQQPAVSVDPTGRFVVTWSELTSIRARQYNGNGNPTGPEMGINIAAGGHVEPDVASNSDGSFAIVWTHTEPNSSQKNLLARAFNKNGLELVPQSSVNQFQFGDQHRAAISIRNNLLAVCWTSDYLDHSEDGIAGLFADPQDFSKVNEMPLRRMLSNSPGVAKVADAGDRQNLADDFYLAQNYPNPFNPETHIRYQISNIRYQNGSFGLLNLAIFDVQGKKIRTLVNKIQPLGSYQVTWDGRNDAGNPVASGIYLYRLNFGSYQLTRRMLLIR